MKRKYDHTNKSFGKWTVLSRASPKNRNDRWNVKCKCGTLSIVLGTELRKGTSKGCKKCHKLTHGMSKTRTYNIWCGMKDRCNNPNNSHYHSYGARGINVCDRWLNSFINFFEDMGESPTNLSLDRIDNDKGYFKENCKWSDNFIQQRNTRKSIKIGTIRGNWCLKKRLFNEGKAIIECIFCKKTKMRAFANFRQNRIGKCGCSISK